MHKIVVYIEVHVRAMYTVDVSRIANSSTTKYNHHNYDLLDIN